MDGKIDSARPQLEVGLFDSLKKSYQRTHFLTFKIIGIHSSHTLIETVVKI